MYDDEAPGDFLSVNDHISGFGSEDRISMRGGDSHYNGFPAASDKFLYFILIVCQIKAFCACCYYASVAVLIF